MPRKRKKMTTEEKQARAARNERRKRDSKQLARSKNKVVPGEPTEAKAKTTWKPRLGRGDR